MTTTDTGTRPGERLRHFPISTFGISMGVFGLALSLHAGGLETASRAVGYAGIAILAFLFSVLLLKAARYPGDMRGEWDHPVRLAFFPATSISLMLMAAFLLPVMPQIARPVWILGATMQALLTLLVISSWISHRAFGPGHLSPAWFIPAVGNVVGPLAGVALGYTEISWYFFAVGLVFWIVLLTLVFNRLIFHDPVPEKLRPTLVILIAPPAVSVLAWLQLNGGTLDATARVLLNAGYFFALLVALQMPAIVRLPFALSFWALSFPLAALTVASFRFAGLAGSPFHQGVGYVLLALLALTVAALALRTGKAVLENEICKPE